MLLEELSYPEVEDYLKHSDTILIPVGAVEQHSPYGLIGTDFMAAEAVARRCGEKMALMVAPSLNYGISPHHMAFAGSATVHPETFIRLCADLMRSFSAHGFRRIFFINGHGGNIHALHTAIQIIKQENVSGMFDLFSWYQCTGVKRFNLRSFEGKEGEHATPSEISVTMHLRPEAFVKKATEPRELITPDTYWPLTASEMKTVYPDGRMDSAPWLANPETGGQLLEAAVEDLCKKLEQRLNLPLAV